MTLLELEQLIKKAKRQDYHFFGREGLNKAGFVSSFLQNSRQPAIRVAELFYLLSTMRYPQVAQFVAKSRMLPLFLNGLSLSKIEELETKDLVVLMVWLRGISQACQFECQLKQYFNTIAPACVRGFANILNAVCTAFYNLYSLFGIEARLKAARLVQENKGGQDMQQEPESKPERKAKNNNDDDDDDDDDDEDDEEEEEEEEEAPEDDQQEADLLDEGDGQEEDQFLALRDEELGQDVIEVYQILNLMLPSLTSIFRSWLTLPVFVQQFAVQRFTQTLWKTFHHSNSSNFEYLFAMSADLLQHGKVARVEDIALLLVRPLYNLIKPRGLPDQLEIPGIRYMYFRDRSYRRVRTGLFSSLHKVVLRTEAAEYLAQFIPALTRLIYSCAKDSSLFFAGLSALNQICRITRQQSLSFQLLKLVLVHAVRIFSNELFYIDYLLEHTDFSHAEKAKLLSVLGQRLNNVKEYELLPPISHIADAPIEVRLEEILRSFPKVEKKHVRVLRAFQFLYELYHEQLASIQIEAKQQVFVSPHKADRVENRVVRESKLKMALERTGSLPPRHKDKCFYCLHYEEMALKSQAPIQRKKKKRLATMDSIMKLIYKLNSGEIDLLQSMMSNLLSFLGGDGYLSSLKFYVMRLFQNQATSSPATLDFLVAAFLPEFLSSTFSSYLLRFGLYPFIVRLSGQTPIVKSKGTVKPNTEAVTKVYKSRGNKLFEQIGSLTVLKGEWDADSRRIKFVQLKASKEYFLNVLSNKEQKLIQSNLVTQAHNLLHVFMFLHQLLKLKPSLCSQFEKNLPSLTTLATVLCRRNAMDRRKDSKGQVELVALDLNSLIIVYLFKIVLRICRRTRIEQSILEPLVDPYLATFQYYQLQVLRHTPWPTPLKYIKEVRLEGFGSPFRERQLLWLISMVQMRSMGLQVLQQLYPSMLHFINLQFRNAKPSDTPSGDLVDWSKKASLEDLRWSTACRIVEIVSFAIKNLQGSELQTKLLFGMLSQNRLFAVSFLREFIELICEYCQLYTVFDRQMSIIVDFVLKVARVHSQDFKDSLAVLLIRVARTGRPEWGIISRVHEDQSLALQTLGKEANQRIREQMILMGSPAFQFSNRRNRKFLPIKGNNTVSRKSDRLGGSVEDLEGERLDDQEARRETVREEEEGHEEAVQQRYYQQDQSEDSASGSGSGQSKKKSSGLFW